MALKVICPDCQREYYGSALICVNCGASLIDQPRLPGTPMIMEQVQQEHETSPPETVPEPNLEPADQAILEAPDEENRDLTGEEFVCQVCGRQDASLRYVTYPYVVSLVFITWQRGISGLWCRRHRWQWLSLAGAITALIGWIGIPHGLINAPKALIVLANGGEPYPEKNADLQRQLAEQKFQSGNLADGLRCLEASLKYQDDPEVCKRLQRYRPTASIQASMVGCSPALLMVAAMLVGAAAIGVVIGILDYFLTMGMGLIPYLSEAPFFIGLLTWSPFLTMSFLGGLGLFRLVEWGLARLHARRKFIAVALGAVMAILAGYSIPQGSMIAEYLMLVISGQAETVAEGIGVGLMICLWGGLSWLSAELEWLLAGTASPLYLVSILVVAIYFLVFSIRWALNTVRWQQRIAGDL